MIQKNRDVDWAGGGGEDDTGSLVKLFGVIKDQFINGYKNGHNPQSINVRTVTEPPLTISDLEYNNQH